MKRFLQFKVSNKQRVIHNVVIMGILMTTSACATHGGGGSDADHGYYMGNNKISFLSAGEAAVVNDVETRKVHSPNFLVNDPYTALSPDEMIRLYGKK